MAASHANRYSPLGGDIHWTLPLSWVGKKISVRALPRDSQGKAAVAPTLAVAGRVLTLKGLTQSTPVILSVLDLV